MHFPKLHVYTPCTVNQVEKLARTTMETLNSTYYTQSRNRNTKVSFTMPHFVASKKIV